MVHRRLYLLVHRLLHLSLCVSPVAVEDHEEDQDGDEANDQDLAQAVSVVADAVHADLVIVL